MKCWAFWDSKIYLMPAPSSNAAGWNFTMNCRPRSEWRQRTGKRDRMKKEMLINVLQPEECRIAILEDGVLEELYVERTSHESYVGNIYKGRIVNIEPSIQAAFVDFGVGRNGFLHVSDVEPTYYRHLQPHRGERNGQRDRSRGREEEHPQAPLEYEAEGLEESLAPLDEASTLLPDEAALEVQSPDEVVEITETETSEARAGEPSVQEPAEALQEEREAESSPSVTALPQTPIEEEPGRRRRLRGRARSRRDADEPAAEEAASEEEEASANEADQVSEETVPQTPPYMESAERRTTEGGPEISPSGSVSGSSDEEMLFFPREPETTVPPSPHLAQGPQAQSSIEEVHSPEIPSTPPPRVRPTTEECQGSIEETL